MRPLAQPITTLLALVVAMPWPLYALADGAHDEAMRTLAETSGCFICHSIDDTTRRPGSPRPVGPHWADVAERYADDATAPRRLTAEVMQGGSARSRHWKEKASGVAMPANEVVVGEAEASALVAWILALPRKR